MLHGQLLEEECTMRWNVKYVVRSYVSHSMWLVPFFALLFYTVFHRATYALGAWLLRSG